MFQHFGNRLKRDLKQLVDRRLDISALSSGSSIKVGVRNEMGVLRKLTRPSQSSGVEVEVISHKRQRYVYFHELSSVLWTKVVQICCLVWWLSTRIIGK